MVECDELALRPTEGWKSVEGEKDPRKTGIYRGDNHLVAVNRPIKENDLERLSIDDAKKLFGNLTFQLYEEKARPGGTDCRERCGACF